MRGAARIAGLVIVVAAATSASGQGARSRHRTQVSGGNPPPLCSGITPDHADAYAGDTVSLSADAKDPDGDAVTYTWTATAGRVLGSGERVAFDTTGLAEGTYRVAALVNDGYGHAAECSATVEVVKRPDGCPTVTLTADKTSVAVGEPVTFTATASNPKDGSGPIRYEWTAAAGSLNRVSDSEVRLDTTGLFGAVVVFVWVTDDTGCRAAGAAAVEIEKGNRSM